MVRNAAIGRGRGFVAESVALFCDYRSAETILRIPTVAERAWPTGYLDDGTAQAWLAKLTAEPFLAATGRVPTDHDS